MQDLRGKVLCFSTMYADVDSGADIKHSAELKKRKTKGHLQQSTIYAS